ncbi:hypothetical protein GCM10010306_084220 [Streptomyces umbrinus]|nr:hypothetical protein GCM10010306_084220 [Streptomyces umbrinus]
MRIGGLPSRVVREVLLCVDFGEARVGSGALDGQGAGTPGPEPCSLPRRAATWPAGSGTRTGWVPSSPPWSEPAGRLAD